MDISTVAIWVLGIGLAALAMSQGKEAFLKGLSGSWQSARSLIPLLAGVFIIIGFADVLIPKEFIADLLGQESGFRGILIACGLGALTPGGPFVSYPLVATLYRAGAGIGPIVAFVTAWSLLAVSRLPLELGVVGWRLTLIRLASSFIFPPLAGLVATTLFPRG